mgnify:CR=1 FL=1
MVWRPVTGYLGIYEVSSDGEVRSLDRVVVRSNGVPVATRGKLLKPNEDKAGYLYINLSAGGRRRRVYIHQLVASAFVGDRQPGMQICHNNGIKADNRAVNLRYDTASANQRDRVKHGTHHHARKTECARGHAYTETNTRFRVRQNKCGPSIVRDCLTCEAQRKAARSAARAAAREARGWAPWPDRLEKLAA